MTKRLPIAMLLAVGALQAGDFFLRDGQRIVFLGDSITQGGAYVEDVEAFLLTEYPKQRFEVIKLGLSSETASGLSERDHPFPRPNIHDRLDSALEKSRPNVVVFNYGMNDGIYHPFSENRFRAYQEGINRLIAKIRAAGAIPAAMTPPPFDPLPKRGVVVDASAQNFGYKTPFKDYDSVLQRYGEWLLTLRSGGLMVIDDHRPMRQYIAKQREKSPGFTLSRDGTHPGSEGHWLMAEAILEAWSAPASRVERFHSRADAGARPEAQVLRLIQEKWKIMGPAWLYKVGNKRNPAPVDFEAAERKALALERSARELATSALQN